MGSEHSSWTRSKVTAALSVAIVVVVGSLAGPSHAQESEQAGAIPTGAAKAVAVLTKVAPGVGGLDLAATSGVSVAETTNSVAQSQAQGMDLGLIGTSLTAEGCDGDSTIKPEDLPQPIRVDNRKGDASASHDEVPLGPAGALRLAVKATEVPSSTASSRGVGLGVPGLLEFGSGTAIAETRSLEGAGREARAVVQTSLELGGAIQLRGLRWEAVHRTGAERRVEGSFELGGLDVGGVPVPLEDLEAAQEALNTALEFTGVRIELPRVEKLTEPTDLVRVTPLRIQIKDSEAGATLLGPVLNASRAQREQLFQQLGEAVCDLKGLLLVADVGVAIMSGSGFLTIDIGGVEAISSDFAIGEAIGVPPVAVGSIDAPVAPAAVGAGTGTASTPGAVNPPAGDTAAPELGGAPVADLGPLERVCESVHPFEWPSCSRGAAPAAGLIGILATGGVFALDYRRQRGLLTAAAPSGEVPAS